MSWRQPRRGSRTAASLVAAIVAVMLGAVPASAHSSLERSEPPHGGKVAVGRTTLTLWFSEPISQQASVFELETEGGVKQALTVSVSEGVVEVTTEPLAQDTYLLDWAVLSLEDGHIERGSIVFGVGVTPDVALAADVSLPEAPELLLRWLDLAVLMLVIGALAVSGRVLGSIRTSKSAVLEHARYIGAFAAGAAVVTGALTPFFRVPRGDSSVGAWLDTTLSALTGSPWGQLWMAREAALIVVAVALWRGISHIDHKRPRARAAVVALVAVVALESWAGHASALPRQSGLAAAASGAHLVAAGVWAGGLTVLALCLFPVMRRNPDTRGPMLASAFRTFSPMAATATVVLLATGLYESGRHIPGLDGFSSTAYGSGVAAKIALASLALVLAGFNMLLINPRLAAPIGRLLRRPVGWAPVSLRRFTRVVAAEALVLLVALGVAALVTSVPSAREIEAASQETTPLSANAEKVFVTFEVVPAGADQNRLIVRAQSTQRPDPAPITGVLVSLTPAAGSPADVPLDVIEQGRYEAAVDKLDPGAWQITVAMDRGTAPEVLAEFEWAVPDAIPEGVRPLELATTSLAVLLLVAAAGAARFASNRRETPAESTPLAYQRTES